MSILKPWTPVEVNKTDNGYDISVLGRRYSLSEKSPFFSSVISKGEEILASPMRIVAENKSVVQEFCKAKTLMMESSNGERVDLISTMESKYVIVNVSHGIEFDGCDEITLSVMPTGPNVAAAFGLEPFETDGFDMNKLYLEVPLKKNLFKYYAFYPETQENIFNDENEADDFFGKTAVFKSAGAIAQSGMHFPYRQQIYLSSDERGIGFFFESDEHFNNSDKTRTFEIINNGDEIVLRISFFDEAPSFWRDKGENNNSSRSMCPITYRFGMQVTPVKPMENYPHTEKNFHVDCFCKIDRETPYDVYFSNAVIDGDDEIGFDRIKRLGVETLYIHEKWNDIQSSIYLTDATSNRLKYIVSECHKRGIRVIPYFGYEISTLSPIFHKTGRKHTRIYLNDGKLKNYTAAWYRYPYQRDLQACYYGEYRDIFADGLIALQKEYGFDGFYFDGTILPITCVNREHGCGYVDEEGNVHATSRQFELRKFFKKIYKYTSENNLTIEVHTPYDMMYCCGFYDHSWSGEDIQATLLMNKLDRAPESLLMARTAARDIGAPSYMLCYSNENWSFESACGLALLYGSRPKPVDIKKPLEYMSKIWKIFDDFPMKEAKFLPYYNGNDSVLSDNDDVKITVYETDDKILAICTSIDMSTDADVTISGKFDNVSDAFTGYRISDNGKCELHFSGIDCKILILDR
ncbi:MAG: hypothetical protein IJP16_05520 [Clostridia bacterium]|nr:hypothetical protein [Clostridia bacterium]